MKVRITQSTSPMSIAVWWYAEHVGEVIEVEPDPEKDIYYFTMREHKGQAMKHHILKLDCEVIEGAPAWHSTAEH